MTEGDDFIPEQQPFSNPDYERVKQLLHQHEKELMAKANVVGIGIGYREKGKQRLEELSLVVFVSQKLPRVMLKPEDILPHEIEGVHVDVKEVGSLVADLNHSL